MSERLDTEARKLLDLRTASEKSAAAAKKDKEKLVEQERSFYEMLENQNVPTTTLDLGPGYGRVQFGRRKTIYSRVINIDAAVEALKAEGRSEEMIKTDLRKAPLNELVRDRLENGEPLPDGVDFSETRYIQVTRRKA